MDSRPLVTIIIPCFEDHDTLSMTLASVVMQTIERWECVIIDDGSEEAIAPIVHSFDERRFRLFSFAKNRGRSVARQTALEEARGEYVCMLDADDWYYQNKLERQLAVMEERKELVAVSTAMAVIDEDDELVGIRSVRPSRFHICVGERNRTPAIYSPSVMLRRKEALQHRFDPGLERSEDLDYMRRLLAGRPYAVMPDVMYAYREVYSDESMGEALCGFHNQRKVLRQHFSAAPLEIGRQYLWSLVKTGVYGAARVVGRGEWLFSRRNRKPTTQESQQFLANRQRIRQSLEAEE